VVHPRWIRAWPIAAFVACVVLLGLVVAHEVAYDLAPLAPGGAAALEHEHHAPAGGGADPLDAVHAWLEAASGLGLGGLLASAIAALALAGRRSPGLVRWARTGGRRGSRLARAAFVLGVAPGAFLLVEVLERAPVHEGLPPLQVAIAGALAQVVVASASLVALRALARVVRRAVLHLARRPSTRAHGAPEVCCRCESEPRPRRGRAAGAPPSRGPPRRSFEPVS
jgi:hypothetical protein